MSLILLRLGFEFSLLSLVVWAATRGTAERGCQVDCFGWFHPGGSFARTCWEVMVDHVMWAVTRGAADRGCQVS